MSFRTEGHEFPDWKAYRALIEINFERFTSIHITGFFFFFNAPRIKESSPKFPGRGKKNPSNINALGVRMALNSLSAMPEAVLRKRPPSMSGNSQARIPMPCQAINQMSG